MNITHGAVLTEFGRRANIVPEDKTVEEEYKERHDQSKAILSGLEIQDPFLHSLWQETSKWSFDEFAKIYAWLGTPFDVNFTESQVSKNSLLMVKKLYAEGKLDELPGNAASTTSTTDTKTTTTAIVSTASTTATTTTTSIQPAIGLNLEKYGFKGYGFCLLQKSNGSGLYATKDLTLAKLKFDEYKIDKSVYVVASEQTHHFKQVIQTLFHLCFFFFSILYVYIINIGI